MAANNMIKITTPKQFEVLVRLMEKHPELAKGYQKNLNKINVKHEWCKIAEELNAVGPPTRTGEGWMKVWADFKFKLKKKLVHNKAEIRATGGGPYKQYILSPVEEAAANLLQIESVINPGPSFGIRRDASVSKEAEPTTDMAYSCDESQDVSTSKYVKKSKPTRNNAKEKVSLLEEQIKLQGELCGTLKAKLDEIERYSRKTYKLKEEKFKLFKIELKKKDEHRRKLLELRKSELELKRRKVELEELRTRIN